MTSNSIDYLKALETVDNSHPTAVGFVNPAETTITGDKFIISKNNLIIELLLRLHVKLDRITGRTEPLPPNLATQLEQITASLTNLTTGSKKVTTVSSSTQPLVVWKDPKTLFPK